MIASLLKPAGLIGLVFFFVPVAVIYWAIVVFVPSSSKASEEEQKHRFLDDALQKNERKKPFWNRDIISEELFSLLVVFIVFIGTSFFLGKMMLSDQPSRARSLHFFPLILVCVLILFAFAIGFYLLLWPSAKPIKKEEDISVEKREGTGDSA